LRKQLGELAGQSPEVVSVEQQQPKDVSEVSKCQQ